MGRLPVRLRGAARRSPSGTAKQLSLSCVSALHLFRKPRVRVRILTTAAVRAFLEWIFDNYQLSSTSEVDDLLLEYLHDFYLAGGCKSKANNTVYGVVMLLPGVRHRIPSSRLALRGWSRLHPPQSYPPLTWELAVVIGVQMARGGRLAEGIATVLGFHCYLRLGEICNLRVSDVADSGDARVGGTVT